MPTTEASIFNALMARVHTIDLGIPVAWPNDNFPGQSRYLEVTFIPNGVQRIGVTTGTPHRHIGLLQISVWGERNKGESAPRETAGLVAEHFPADLRLTSGGVSVRITQDPDVGGMLVDQQGAQIPVTISWEAFA